MNLISYVAKYMTKSRIMGYLNAAGTRCALRNLKTGQSDTARLNGLTIVMPANDTSDMFATRPDMIQYCHLP